MPVTTKRRNSVWTQMVPERFRGAAEGLDSAMSSGDPATDAMLSLTGPLATVAAPAARGAHWLGGLADRAIAGTAGREGMAVGPGLGRQVVQGADMENAMALRKLRQAAQWAREEAAAAKAAMFGK